MDWPESECIDIIIPNNAIEVKITNLVNPYFMRFCEIRSYTKKKSIIRSLLRNLANASLQSTYHKNNKEYTPLIGDSVIISACEKLDLPDWICRGIITDVKEKTAQVFLMDFGISVNVPREYLEEYPSSLISEKPLTLTGGIHNILPLNSEFRICKQWPKTTITFVKDVIQASEKTYFEISDCDSENNRVYGDMFLIIGDKNISLRKILIHSFLAIPLTTELMKMIENNVDTEEISLPYKLRNQNAGNYGRDQAYITNDVTKKDQFLYSNKEFTREKILIRSKFSCHPIEHIPEARFTASIHKALNNSGIRTPKQIQSYMWSALKQGLNVVAVSPRASGKILGYAIPIINNIIENFQVKYEIRKNGSITRPVALILCAHTYKCMSVTDMCNKLSNEIKFFAAFNGLDDKKLMTNILNKFHVLVSTPQFLLRLLEKYSDILNMSELSHLVIDHADVVVDKYLPEVIKLIKNCKIIENDSSSSAPKSLQIVTTAESWSEKLHSFVSKFIADPYICIGSFTEAAAFCRIKGRMLIRHSDKKKNEVFDVLEDYLKNKTMVFCLHSREAIELNNFLIDKSIKTLLVHEDMKKPEIQAIKEEWTKYISGTYPVVICTDQILSELEISNIDFLIHYSITDSSKTQFTRRFSVLMDNWLKETGSKCRVLILFDETKENAHFKGIIEILKRFKVELPADWEIIADGLDLQNNLRKKNYPICDDVKSFGSCDTSPCPYRHRVIADSDNPKFHEISIGDELKLSVTYIFNANSFSARILECIKEDGSVITFSHKILQFNTKIQKYYSNASNRRALKDFIVGTICITKENDTFSRVLILNIEEKEERTNKPKRLRLKHIDDGKISSNVPVQDLYEIADEFVKCQFPIVDIFLTGIAPFDNEKKWTDIANRACSNWFKENTSSSSSYVSAKVQLHLGNAIWTDSLVVHSKITGYPDLVSSTLTSALEKQGHGTKNEDHLSNLLNLYTSSDIFKKDHCTQ